MIVTLRYMLQHRHSKSGNSNCITLHYMLHSTVEAGSLVPVTGKPIQEPTAIGNGKSQPA
jgi:hypothetical protein